MSIVNYFRYAKEDGFDACPHDITLDNVTEILDKMPISAKVLAGYWFIPFAVIQAILMYFGHDYHENRSVNPEIEACSFKIPFDNEVRYSGETAPYCGHAYSGSNVLLIDFLRRGRAEGIREYNRRVIADREANINMWDRTIRRRYHLALTRLNVHVPEAYDNESYFPRGITREFYAIEEVKDSHTDQWIWLIRDISEVEFDEHRAYSSYTDSRDFRRLKGDTRIEGDYY